MTRRNREHGAAPWYLMFTILAAIGTGFVVYRVLHKQQIAAAAERARAPKPAPKPVEVAAVPEAVPEPTEAPVPEEPTPPAEPVAVDDAVCDEVSCVLDNYERACCAKFKKPRTASADDAVPENLERAMISAGIRGVTSRIAACVNASSATGKVKVKVVVAPDGSVTVATVQETPDPDLGACVVSMVKKARFAKTQTGGSFSYPFVF